MTDEELLKPNPENKELVKVTPIKNSPFKLVEADGKYFIALANYRLTSYFDDPKKAIKFTHTNKWDIILSMIQVMDDLKNKSLTLS